MSFTFPYTGFQAASTSAMASSSAGNASRTDRDARATGPAPPNNQGHWILSDDLGVVHTHCGTCSEYAAHVRRHSGEADYQAARNLQREHEAANVRVAVDAAVAATQHAYREQVDQLRRERDSALEELYELRRLVEYERSRAAITEEMASRGRRRSPSWPSTIDSHRRHERPSRRS